jgi:hypothetical protein
MVDPHVSPILDMQSTVQPLAGPPWGVLHSAEAMSSSSSRSNTAKQVMMMLELD